MDRRTRLAFLIVVAGGVCVLLACVTNYLSLVVAGAVLAVFGLGVAAWPRA